MKTQFQNVSVKRRGKTAFTFRRAHANGFDDTTTYTTTMVCATTTVIPTISQTCPTS